MTKISWAKEKKQARSRDRAAARLEQRTAAYYGDRALRETARRAAATEFAGIYDLACFKCKTTEGVFARANREPDGRRWALCAHCFDHKRASD